MPANGEKPEAGPPPPLTSSASRRLRASSCFRSRRAARITVNASTSKIPARMMSVAISPYYPGKKASAKGSVPRSQADAVAVHVVECDCRSVAVDCDAGAPEPLGGSINRRVALQPQLERLQARAIG